MNKVVLSHEGKLSNCAAEQPSAAQWTYVTTLPHKVVEAAKRDDMY